MSSIFAVVATSWGVLMSAAPLFQVRLILKRRDSAGGSIWYTAILLIGFVLWLVYGITIGNIPIMATNTASMTVALFTLGIILHFRPVIARAACAPASEQDVLER